MLVPPTVVTVTGTAPAVTATGAVTASWVADTTARFVPGAVPNETAVAPLRFVPVTVTLVPPPVGALAGDTLDTVGAATAVT